MMLMYRLCNCMETLSRQLVCVHGMHTCDGKASFRTRNKASRETRDEVAATILLQRLCYSCIVISIDSQMLELYALRC
jgi:hypothetical protein